MNNSPSIDQLQSIWDKDDLAWRHPAQALSIWNEAGAVAPNSLAHCIQGPWWELLEEMKIQLIVTREYEHLLIMLQPGKEKDQISYFKLPHPSGLAVAKDKKSFHVASTRNPNAIIEFKPIHKILPRQDSPAPCLDEPYWLPNKSIFFPGCLYLHDLAIVGSHLHANAVGHNAVVKFDHKGDFKHVWWPRSIEPNGTKLFDINHLQLNSIAAGKTLRDSFFSASAPKPSQTRPGDKHFKVDEQGVIFSGKTREVYADKLTRPHSARLHHGKLYVNNSGYGGFCQVEKGHIETIRKMAGWTRGLLIHGSIALVGVSRVLPRFRQYAPGLDVGDSRCGIQALDLKTGQVVAEIFWPYGNQIFAIEALPLGSGFFPFKTNSAEAKEIFYAFSKSNGK